MQEVLGEWKEIFGKHGLKLCMEETEVMWVGQQRKETNIRLEGKEISQGNRFQYLGGTVTGDGKFEADVWRRIQVGVNVCRRVEGVVADRKISRKLKRKVLMSCVMPAYLYKLEMVALTERQQQCLQVCETTGSGGLVKRMDRKRMDELRKAEIGVQMSLTGRLVKCQLK